MPASLKTGFAVALLLLPGSWVFTHAQLPTQFDWRDVEGVNYVSGVRDVKQCGSIYIFAPVAMVESRLMMAMRYVPGPVSEVDYSEQDIMSCGSGSFGPFDCGGGNSGDVLEHLRVVGAPHENCNLYDAVEETCPSTCPDSDNDRILHQAVVSWERLNPAPTESELMTEIYQNGPVVANFVLYSDFHEYTTGIYSHTYGSYSGHMATTIIGWGSEGGVRYWICKNAWTENWGEDGYFRMIRDGTDGCNFADFVYTCTVGTPIISAAGVPGHAAFLDQNHPNPFNPVTVIRYRVPADGHVVLRVHDVTGHLVDTLVDGVRVGGCDHEIEWNGRDAVGRPVAAGIYFYRLETADFSETRRMVLIK